MRKKEVAKRVAKTYAVDKSTQSQCTADPREVLSRSH